MTITTPGPGTIEDGAFSYSDANGLSFSGTFDSPTSATGTFALDHWEYGHFDPYVGWHTIEITYSGTWTATFAGTAPSVTVTAPNGGETWEEGSAHDITWISSGTVGNVQIEYSTDSGGSYSVIVASTENDGIYSWTVPTSASATCLVRVSETDGDASDTSDAMFSIVPSATPTITVTSPNGGEVWGIGSVHNIEWSWTGEIANVKIEYSDDGGSYWLTIIDMTANSGSYAWTVPYVWSSSCLIRVTDAENPGVADVSDALFSIVSAIPSSERQALIDFYISTNGDAWNHNTGWKTAPLYSDGFALPGTEGAWYGVAVQWFGDYPHIRSIHLDQENLSGSIPVSMGNLTYLWDFCLDSNQLTGSIPATFGSLTELTRLRLDSNQLSGPIPGSLGNLTGLQWLYIQSNQLSGPIPNSLINMSSLNSSYTDFGYNALYASDPDLVVFVNSKDPDWASTQTTAPTDITATSLDNAVILVSWLPIVYTGDTGYYKILISETPGSGYTIAGQTADKTTSSVQVTDLTPGQTYYFVVQARTDAHANNLNIVESEFSAEASATAWLQIHVTISGTVTVGGLPLPGVVMVGLPHYTVTDDSGAYSCTLEAGWSGTVTPTHPAYTFEPVSQAYTILTEDHLTEDYAATLSGEACTVSGTVILGVTGLAGVTMTGLPHNPVTDALGNYTAAVAPGWLGTVIPTLTNHVFEPASRTYAEITADQTDQDYAATDITPQTINVTSPNGGEILIANSSHNITWTWTGAITDVLIEYSANGGADWAIVVASAANSGSYAWTVSGTASASGLIRVSSAAAPDVADVSDAIFSVVLAIPSLERQALIAFYNATNGDGWNTNYSWIAPPLYSDGFAMPGTEGGWWGVGDDGTQHVWSLYASWNNLVGSLPAELGNLTHLAYLHLSGNSQLSGLIPQELANLTSFQYFDCADGNLSGVIPSELGANGNFHVLWVPSNRLSGPIPASLGNSTGLEALVINSNQLSGVIPSSLINLTNLPPNQTNLGYNALHTTDPGLIAFLNQKDPDWALTQTIAPTEVTATSLDNAIILVSWLPIAYTGDSGCYKVKISETAGGPYTLAGQTTDKMTSSVQVTGLAPGTRYYFVVQTHTDAHANNKNDVDSEYSAEASAMAWTQVSVLISGTITAGGSPLVGVVMSGLTGNPVTDASGDYIGTEAAGWSGTVLPILEGYGFTPPFMTYTGVTENQTDQDYTAAPVQAIPSSERQALIAFYNSTNGDGWTQSMGWKSPPLYVDGFAVPGAEGSWDGVGVDGTVHVNSLYRWSKNLIGSLPAELGNLPHLQQLTIADEAGVSGPIPASLADIASLSYINGINNNFDGSIPSGLGEQGNLQALWLRSNRLGGPIPASLGNSTGLLQLMINSNQLSGAIPPSLLNLTNLEAAYLDIGYNALYASDPDLIAFLNEKDPDWAATQTIAPTGVTATSLDYAIILVSWLPIAYTGDTGFYKVLISETAGGPYTFAGQTTDKTASLVQVTGLTPAKRYYFVVQTHTNAHANNKNVVESENSAEASAVAWTQISVHISGTITAGGSPLAGAVMNGLTGSPVTGASGDYVGTEAAGWSGTVFPALEGYRFTPLSMTYTGVTEDQTGQDYTAAPIQTIPSSERQALIAFYNSTNGDSWTNNSGWKTPPLDFDGFALPGTEGTWYGVAVDSETLHVIQVNLVGNNLTDSLPAALGNLTQLQVLCVGDNPMNGPIPPELAALTHLNELRLYNCQLTDPIPPALGSLANLQYLELYANQLAGSIPIELGNLSNLVGLRLDDNSLDGPIPKELGNLTNLLNIDLGLNELSGPIPAELGDLTELITFRVCSNRLSGPVPSALGNLTHLTSLHLNGNQLAGPLPPSLVNLTALSSDHTDVGYNALYTSDESLITFLNSKDSDWASTQTIAPTQVAATFIGNGTIHVSWVPISYTGDEGSYKVYQSETLGGPYDTLAGQTGDKTATSLEITSLAPGQTYYFVVTTQTSANAYNKNVVESENSAEVSAVVQSHVSFAPKVDYGYLNAAYHISSGDLNRDGTIDLVVGNAGGDDVGLLIGNGDGSFSLTTITAGAVAARSAICDINLDGNPDIVTANYGPHTVSVLLGDGTGGFAPKVDFATGDTGAYFVSAGDLNGDGKPDLAIAHFGEMSTTASVMLNTTAAGSLTVTFGAPSTLAIGGRQWSLALGDLNLDGDLDLVVGSESSQLFIFLGDGSGSLALSSVLSVSALDIKIADVNTDGKPDLAIAAGGAVGLLLGDGTGAFAPMVQFAVSSQARGIDVGDLNGDGRKDVAVSCGGAVSLYFGDGLGGFSTPQEYQTGDYTWSVAIGDFNRDGRPDLAVANEGSHNLSILLNTTPFAESGNLIGGSSQSIGARQWCVALGDLNLDGKLDLTVGSESGELKIYLGDGTGGFSAPSVLSVPAQDINILDVNKDGKPDLAVATAGSAGLLLGNGTGAFAPLASYAVGSQALSIDVGDLNRDGIMDLVVGCRDTGLSILLGNSSGGFDPHVDVNTGNSTWSVAIGDFNRDGCADIAAANELSHTLSVLLGDGTGVFSTQTDYESVPYPYHVAVADLDLDGDSDLIVGSAGSSNVAVHFGDGTGGFVRSLLTTGQTPGRVAACDMDRDGYPDIISANYTSGSVSVFPSDRAGGFGSPVSFSTADSGPYFIAVGDLNADGKPDLAIAHFGESATMSSVLMNSAEVHIAGSVSLDSAPLAGVAMTGLPGTPFTNASGQYTATVAYGWSGTVTPSLEGYSFVPVSRTYATITADQTGQNYAAALIVIPTLTVTVPNGGETWTTGGSANVTWTSTGIVANVDIRLSIDGGATWTTLVDDTANDGAEVVTVPQSPSSECLIMIAEGTSGIPVDQSDLNFTIAAPTLTVMSPNGGESWAAGSTHKITWSQAGVTGDVTIDLYKGGFYQVLIGTAAASAGEYDWAIPSGLTPGTDYQVLVWQGSVSDNSDADFAIVSALPGRKVDFNGDGQEDILWRYYGMGAYQGLNVTWLLAQGGTPSSEPGVKEQLAEMGASLLTGTASSVVYMASAGSGLAAGLVPEQAIKSVLTGREAWALEAQQIMRDTLRRSLESSRFAPDREWGSVMSIPVRKDAVDIAALGAKTPGVASISLGTEVVLSQVLDTGWEIAGTGDFNGDGKTDILWRYYGAGDYQGLNDIWFMDGTTFVSEAVFSQIPDTNWRVAGTGDFNGDGETDILWRYYGTGVYQGLNVIWYMNDATFIGETVFSQVLDTDWRIEGTGDFNRDGETDILWRYYGTGAYQGLNDIWFMNDTTFVSEAVFSQILDTNWQIGGTGDFNNDGHTDILWRYYGTGAYQGLNDIWYMDGTTFVSEEVFSQVPDISWRIANR